MAELMTAESLAARWGCSPRTVNRMAQTRVLPALKRGRHWRFSLDAVQAYERSNTTSTEAAPAQRSGDGSGYRPSNARPAVALGGEYAEIVTGPVPWRSTVIDAASPAAARGRATTTKRTGSQRH